MADVDQISMGRLGQFLQNLFKIEKSVTNLQNENKKLRKSVKKLQKMVSKQAGQLSELRDFVKDAHHDKIEDIAERATLSTIDRIVGVLDQNPINTVDGETSDDTSNSMLNQPSATD